jgi:cysteinyl-tRNA synthetase
MVIAHLGEKFDLHGGGKDLIFPHHENEIAQSEGAYGEDTFARFWMHNGFLNFDGEKMSKSLGNVFGCNEIADAVGAEALRFFCVSHHYRSPVEFDVQQVVGADGTPVARFASLEAADRRLEYFYTTLAKIDALVAQGGDPGDGPVVADADLLISAARDGFADDFNAPVVMAALGDTAKLANKLLEDSKGVDKVVRRRSLARIARDLRTIGEALGVFSASPATYLAERRDRLVKRTGIDVAVVERQIAARKAARAAKDFTGADALRAELAGLGIELFDRPDGSTDWRVHDEG